MPPLDVPVPALPPASPLDVPALPPDAVPALPPVDAPPNALVPAELVPAELVPAELVPAELDPPMGTLMAPELPPLPPVDESLPPEPTSRVAPASLAGLVLHPTTSKSSEIELSFMSKLGEN